MNNSESKNIRVGITHGDFNGISYEIIIKTFIDKRILELVTPIVYGSSKIASYYRKSLDLLDVNFNLVKKADYANSKRVNIINCSNQEARIEIGKSTQEAGEMAFLALEKAMEDLKWNKIDVLVTAPLNKNNIQSDQFQFPGHTEYLASKLEADNHLMLMVAQNLRIGVVTGHIPVRDIPDRISIDLVLKKIRILNKSLEMDFNIRKPKIAILGLNPHAGEEGLIGKEDQEVLIPAIQKANEEDILAFGPFPGDGLFGSSKFMDFDAILAMYHDQGMIPFKSLAFDTGVNYTAGLPIIRTSPAHGTAYDIAGKNIASPDSLRHAIYLAVDVYRNRLEYQEINKNPLETNHSKQPVKNETMPHHENQSAREHH